MEEIYRSLLDSVPYPIVFVNLDHEIIYINKRADDVFHKEDKYPNIVGQSIFHCHNDRSKEMILEAVERFRNGGGEEYLTITKRNERTYVTPVRNENGELLGYYERHELNEAWKATS